MVEPGRSFTSSSYRYGFNGQEKDDEIAGVSGANSNTSYWEYDARLGRRWNVDVYYTEWQSLYACFNNNPVFYNDPDGMAPQDNNAGAPEAKKKILKKIKPMAEFMSLPKRK